MIPFNLSSYSPSNLQHSLLSYLVRRFLAPFLKDGIESLDNLSSNSRKPGVFILTDLQLNPKALQDHLVAFISPFTIECASVSQISLEIDWPSWSFSLQGYVPDVKINLDDIHITLGISEFQTDPLQTQSQSSFLESINLSQNLASIANDFVREGWPNSPGDESSQNDFPGAFNTKTQPTTSSVPLHQDSQGFFAGLVQKILSKFNFQFNRLNVLLHHHEFQLLLSIDQGSSLDLTTEYDQIPNSLSREIRISCPTIYLQPVSDHPTDPIPSSSSSSNQSFDSEHDMLMSQATVDLRCPPLFVSAEQFLQTSEQLPSQSPSAPTTTNPIIDLKNVLIQFTGTSTDSPTHSSEPIAQPIPLSETSHSQNQVHPLNPNQSLRFLVWLNQGSSSDKYPEEKCSVNRLDPTGPSEGIHMMGRSIQSSRLKIKVLLPILSVSIQLPTHLHALNRLISTVLLAIPSKTTCSQPSSISSASDTPSLVLSVALMLDNLNFTISFPTPYDQLADSADRPLSSVTIRTQKIQLTYDTPIPSEFNETQFSKNESQLFIQFDHIQGMFNLKQQQKNQRSATQINSTFLLAPARDDHPSNPALSISLQANGNLQVTFSSVWLNVDLEPLSILTPVIEILRQANFFTFDSPPTRTSRVFGENYESPRFASNTRAFKSSNRAKGYESHHCTIDEEDSNSTTTTTFSIPRLYLDIKSFPTPQTPHPSKQQHESGLVFGSVIKSLQVITNSKKQLACSIFEAAFGFRTSNNSRSPVNEGDLIMNQKQAPLEPFLGIAHPFIPNSKEDPNRYPGFRLTHTLGSHNDLKSSPSLDQSSPSLFKPTCVKVETVTIDLTKHQFDRLQYWLDDLSKWANKFLFESSPGSNEANRIPNVPLQGESRILDDSSTRSENEETSYNRNVDDIKEKPRSNPRGTLTVCKLSISIRLPSSSLIPNNYHEHDQNLSSSKTKDDHAKLVLQFNQLQLCQFVPYQTNHCHRHSDDGYNQIKFTITSCFGSLLDHQKKIIAVVLFSPENRLNSTDKRPSISMSICSTTQSPPSKLNLRASSASSISKNQKEQIKSISIGVEVRHLSLRLGPCCAWTDEVAKFLKAPAGVFDAVGPEYETRIKFSFINCSIQLVSPSSTVVSTETAQTNPSTEGVSKATGGRGFMIEMVSNHAHLQISLDPPSASMKVSPTINGTISLNLAEFPDTQSCASTLGAESISFTQVAALNDFQISMLYSWCPPNFDQKPTFQIKLLRGSLIISLCADSADGLSQAIARVSEIPFKFVDHSSHQQVRLSPSSNETVDDPIVASSMLRSAMREPSSASSRPLLIEKDEDLADEDYPTDATFVDRNNPASHDRRSHHHPSDQNTSVIIRSLCEDGLNIIDDFLLRNRVSSKVSQQNIQAEVQVLQLDVSINLHDGYDWDSTRQTIQQAKKTIRKRLQKIRQLLATGNPANVRSIEEDLIKPATKTLFNSVQLGLNSETRGLSSAQLLNVIDSQLENQEDGLIEPAVLDDETECMTGSWQSLAPHSSPVGNIPPPAQPRRKLSSSTSQSALGRSNQPMLKLVLNRLKANFRKFDSPSDECQNFQNENEASRLCSLKVKIDSLTVIDNIKSSTWKKFLTELRPNEGGSLRPTGEPMLRFKFDLNPSTNINTPSRSNRKNSKNSNEATLKLKVTPLRLYVDQDAVDFLKNFFSFRKDSSSPPATDSTGSEELFFQRVEILPVRIKLDYKPKRINYMALKEGNAIELMNFFHFEGSDMILRHATLTGVSRASRIGELLQEIWTPDVKANQLADVISGISPVRSVVNLGTGIADLILLPIEEIKKKDGRLSRGISKGTSSFAKNTTLEVIKLGAKLATGTQVILEKAESIFGGGSSGSGNKLNQDLRVETIDHHHLSPSDPDGSVDQKTNRTHHHTDSDLSSYSHHQDHHSISKYANQPPNFTVGAQLAYQDLRENFRSTAQTILAIPLEVFNEGSGQAVVKAIPIAFIHPIVGATSAISKTLLGLQNSLSSNADQTNLIDDKYKRSHYH